MATSPVIIPATTAAATVKTESGFERFIDKIGSFFVKAEPVVKEVENAAIAAEPVLALTPFGPEYDIVVNAIVGAQKVGTASLAANSTLTGDQKAALALQAAEPALTTILKSKGVTDNTQTIISTFIKSVFGLLAGPVVVTPSTTAAS